MCVVGIRRNSTSVRGPRFRLYRLLSALRHLKPRFWADFGDFEKNGACGVIFNSRKVRFPPGFSPLVSFSPFIERNRASHYRAICAATLFLGFLSPPLLPCKKVDLKSNARINIHGAGLSLSRASRGAVFGVHRWRFSQAHITSEQPEAKEREALGPSKHRTAGQHQLHRPGRASPWFPENSQHKKHTPFCCLRC